MIAATDSIILSKDIFESILYSMYADSVSKPNIVINVKFDLKTHWKVSANDPYIRGEVYELSKLTESGKNYHHDTTLLCWSNDTTQHYFAGLPTRRYDTTLLCCGLPTRHSTTLLVYCNVSVIDILPLSWSTHHVWTSPWFFWAHRYTTLTVLSVSC